MERWERNAYRSFEGAQEKLKDCREVWLYRNEEEDVPLWYVDIGDGNRGHPTILSSDSAENKEK